MAKRHYWGHALTAIGLVGALAACSNSMSGPKSASAKVDPSKVGIATRAQAALASGDLATALNLGEAAVEYRPADARFRALLGNIFIWSGTVFYPDYRPGQASWDLTPLADQGAAGTIMMIESGRIRLSYCAASTRKTSRMASG